MIKVERTIDKLFIYDKKIKMPLSLLVDIKVPTIV